MRAECAEAVSTELSVLRVLRVLSVASVLSVLTLLRVLLSSATEAESGGLICHAECAADRRVSKLLCCAVLCVIAPQAAKVAPKDPDLRKKLSECEKAVKRIRFEEALSTPVGCDRRPMPDTAQTWGTSMC